MTDIDEIKAKYIEALEMIELLRAELNCCGYWHQSYLKEHFYNDKFQQFQSDLMKNRYTVQIEGIPEFVIPKQLKFLNFNTDNSNNITSAACIVRYEINNKE